MDSYLIDVPIPSMGATVNELTIVSLKVQSGAQVTKGQKVAELESDKSIFEFECPCDGTIQAIMGGAGDVKPSGAPFLRILTTDSSLKHLEVKQGGGPKPEALAAAHKAAVTWTPRAIKLAQEAGMDPASIHDIEATGPGNRVSGDDLNRYLAKQKLKSS